MTTGKTIVVAVRDEENGRIALQRALHLAQSPLDRIRLVHVSHYESWLRVSELLTPQWKSPDGEHNPDRHDWLQRLAKSVEPKGPNVEFEVLDGEPGAAIVDFARQVVADLIVVATPREGQVRELFIGSTALRILRTAPCPVVVARARIATHYQRALVAVELDDAGQRVAHAASAWLAGANIDLVHAYRVPQEGQMRTRGGVNEEEITKLREFVRADHAEKLNVYRVALPNATIHLEHGWAASVILDLALRLRPDILVLSKHRGSSKEERIFGSVTQFLLYECPTDILLVP